MDLVARVEQALADRPVHPTEFERCACALLQTRYPGLSAVEGGHDFGRDADIYFPFGPGDSSSRGRLLATTGDPAANLRTGLKRMQEEGVSADLVVVACLRPVSATVRKSLDAICGDYAIGPPHVYARDWFVAQLVREPAWRERLLGIAGELTALLDLPLEMLEQVTPAPVLVGRNGELAALRERAGSGLDTIVIGVPGVGKTRLTAEIGREVVFLEPAEAGRVVDELLLRRPRAVVVDNAHVRTGELRNLRRARQQERLSFAIIATTWPDRSGDVAAELPDASIVDVGLLRREDMNQLVKLVGVTGYRTRAHVLQQAGGRPGWALALCEMFVTGQGFEVVSGAALLANVERFLRRASESELAMDVLACVAALGPVPDETRHRLAGELGVPPAELAGLLNRLARNGLAEYSDGGWHLQPTIRSALVARWFFTKPVGRPWATLQTAFPDRSLDLAGAAIAAAQVGSTGGRREADAWARSLPDPSGWDMVTFAVVSEYSALDEQCARFAVVSARAVLAGPPRPQKTGGLSYDPMRHAAFGQLVRVVNQWVLPDAVSGLLDLAVGDNRPRPQTPDHPLRVLAETAGRIDPDFGTDVTIRERILGCTLTWLAEARDIGRWMTAAEMLSAIFTTEVSGTWPDPGAPDTVTISQGIDSAAHLEHLIDLWDRAAGTINGGGEAGQPQCPPQALAVLVDLAGEWMRLGSASAPSDMEVSAEQRRAGTRGGRTILESLRPAVQAVPGLAIRAQRLIDEQTRQGAAGDSLTPFNVDRDLRDLAVSRYSFRADDLNTALQKKKAAAETLARRVTSLAPKDGTEEFLELIRQARLAGDNTAGDLVAECMQPHMSEPGAWYMEALQRQDPWLLRAALTQCLAKTPATITEDALRAAMGNPNLRGAVIAAALNRTDLDEAAESVIEDLEISDIPLLTPIFVRETPSEIVHRLLTHHVPEIAGIAAASFAIGQEQGPPLPRQWQPAWRSAVRRMRAENLDQGGAWRMGELLKHLAEHDPDLFEQWFTQQLDEMIQRGFLSEPRPRGCEHHLARLPQPHRGRLARRCAGRPRIGRSMLTYLIDADRELAEQLLDDGTITNEELLEVIAGQRNEVTEQIGSLLLDRGVAPELIAAAAGITHDVWNDPKSHEQALEYFKALGERVPALLPVAEAGRAQQEALRGEAEARK